MIVGNRAGWPPGFGFGKPLRHVRLEVLDRHARRKRHRLFVEPADVELVRRRHVEDELALLLQHVPVVRHEVRERRGRSEQVVALAAAGVVRRDELRARDRSARRAGPRSARPLTQGRRRRRRGRRRLSRLAAGAGCGPAVRGCDARAATSRAAERAAARVALARQRARSARERRRPYGNYTAAREPQAASGRQ